MSSLGSGFFDASIAPLGNISEGNVLKALASISGPGMIFNMVRGASEEQRFATDEMGIFDVDQVKAEESRRRLTSATGVQRGGG